jgi:hypothetical protein
MSALQRRQVRSPSEFFGLPTAEPERSPQNYPLMLEKSLPSNRQAPGAAATRWASCRPATSLPKDPTPALLLHGTAMRYREAG